LFALVACRKSLVKPVVKCTPSVRQPLWSKLRLCQLESPRQSSFMEAIKQLWQTGQPWNDLDESKCPQLSRWTTLVSIHTALAWRFLHLPRIPTRGERSSDLGKRSHDPTYPPKKESVWQDKQRRSLPSFSLSASTRRSASQTQALRANPHSANSGNDMGSFPCK
jgi:hypothetical protein